MFIMSDIPLTGPTFFLTLRLADRRSDLLVREIARLRRAMRSVLEHHPTQIEAMTVLPAVIHAIWTLPAQDQNLARRIHLLKSAFARDLPPAPHRSLFQIQRCEKGIWHRATWDHPIRDGADFIRHRDLIYLAPVHVDLCAHPRDWLYTSLHRDAERGLAVPAGGAPPGTCDRDTALPMGLLNTALATAGALCHRSKSLSA